MALVSTNRQHATHHAIDALHCKNITQTFDMRTETETGDVVNKVVEECNK